MPKNKITSQFGISTITNRKEYDHLYGKKYRAEHKEVVLNYQKDYRKTWDGWLSLTYSHMRMASKIRNHNLPSFTKEELWVWVQSNCKQQFEKAHQAWVASGCQKGLKPSIDRLNNGNGYTLDNIQLLIWKENALKQSASIRKPIIRYTPDGEYIDSFSHAEEASKITGVPVSTIRGSLTRGFNGAGWKWVYAS